jgi:hypothetical protein
VELGRNCRRVNAMKQTSLIVNLGSRFMQALPAPQQLPQLPWSDLQQPQQQQSQQQQQQQLLARRGVIDAAVQQYGQTCEPVQQGVSQHKQTQPPASAPVQKQPVDEVHMNAVLAALPVSGPPLQAPIN